MGTAALSPGKNEAVQGAIPETAYGESTVPTDYRKSPRLSTDFPTAGIRRQSESTRCHVAANLLNAEDSAVIAISLAPARPFPIRQFLAFERAQGRRLEHEDGCSVCATELGECVA